MFESIKNELLKLEHERSIKILYAVESGSRAWGFASKNSDWDVRFIYVHNYDWYLSVQEQKDNIEMMLPNDLDMAGWELKKTLMLFRKSNPPLLEWLHSPLVYLENYSTAGQMREATNVYFNPKSCLYHYLHMAKGNYQAYFKEETVRLKKYLYVLRPLLACCWIAKHNIIAPMEFEVVFNDEIKEGILKSEIEALVKKKMAGEELSTGKRIAAIDEFIELKLEYFTGYLEHFNFTNIPGYQQLNNIFRSTLKEAWI